MDWSKVEKTPEYNPFMFEVARHVRGWTRRHLHLKTWIPDGTRMAVSRIGQIEKGEVSPSEDEAAVLAKALDFPLAFFCQWWKTKLDFSGPLVKSIPIDYYKYKVFRDVNPPRMQIISGNP